MMPWEEQQTPPPERVRRRRKTKRHEKSVIREFGFEITIGFIFLFGVFLLFEEMEIKSWVFQNIVGFFNGITQGFSQMVGTVINWTDLFETSDIVGVILILLAIFLLLYRIRQKAIIRYHDLDSCPDCGSDLMHVHRSFSQRVVSRVFYLKIRRYRCKQCDYEGIRVRTHRSR